VTLDFTTPLVTGPRGPFTAHSGPVETIVIHYTWAETSDMAQVWRWHKARKFNGPGYHYLIRKDGSVEYGRPEWARGAHTRGHNDRTIGIAYEGGRIAGDDKNGHDTRTTAQRKTMTRLIRDIQSRRPSATKVRGHRQLVATQCPGFDAQAWWGKTKAQPAPKDAPALTEPRSEKIGWGAIIKAIFAAIFGGRK
jgi:N-acetylmuramoyl-L-alanine amidase